MKKVKLFYLVFIITLFLVLICFIPNQVFATTNYFKTSTYKITEAKNKVLSNLDASNVSVQNVLANVSINFNTDMYEIRAYNNGAELALDKLIGTGSMLKVMHKNYNYSVDSITIILYGDTNGDGSISATDALAIIKNKTGKIKFENEYFLEAGRITTLTRQKNDVPSSVDALAIIKNKLGKLNISQFRNIQVKVSSYDDLYTQLKQCNTNIEFDKTADNYNEMISSYEKLQRIVKKHCTNEMSQTVKALVLHDYLAAGSILNNDTTYCDNSSKESHICNIDGTMNQLGFANTYTCLLGIAGIPSEIKRDKYANYANNAINEVIIDGQMYYVSCGVDSYLSKVEGKGKLRRYYFLRNTEQLKETFWEGDIYFGYTPSTNNTSTSTKYYGVRWPEYRSTLDYKNNEIKLATGKTIVRSMSELKDAVINKKDYIIDVIDANTESLAEVDQFSKKVIEKYITKDMSEAEKALAIYDFVCSNFMRNDHIAYRERTNVSNSDYDVAWGSYKTSLLSGMGDCIGATNSFNTLCAYAGLETKTINEHQVDAIHGMGNHHWSLVKIDNQWYHCDCEGSDYYTYGQVDRTWFLYSDRAMGATNNTVEACTSTKYDDYDWPEFKGIAYYQDKTDIIDEKVPATSFWTSERTEAIVGDEFAIMTRIFPYGSTDKPTYSSSNPKVATIDNEGNISVLSIGTTTIKIDVNGISKTFTIKTGSRPKDIIAKDMTLKVGQTSKINYEVNPSDALYTKIYWYSSNENIVTVDEDGNVTAVGEGTANIRLSYTYRMGNSTYYSSGKSAKITVTK